MAAKIKIDQVGLPAGVADRSRSDILNTGAQITFTSVEPGTTNVFSLLWVAPGDVNAVASLNNLGVTATCTPTASISGSYKVQLIVDAGLPTESRSIRTFSIRTPSLGLRKPALNERCSELADLDHNSVSYIAASETNEDEPSGPFVAGNYGGYYQAIIELFDAVEALGASPSGISALTGDVTASGSGSVVATIAANAVTFAKMADIATDTLIGRSTAGTGDPEAISCTGSGRAMIAAASAAAQTALLSVMVGDSGLGGTKGLVTAPAAGDTAAGRFLKADGTWAVPPGAGGGGGNIVARRTVTGPTSVAVATTDHVIYVNTTGGAVTLTLPAHGTTDRIFEVIDIAGTFGTNACTLARNGGTGTIGGVAANYVLDAAWQVAKIASDTVNAWWLH